MEVTSKEARGSSAMGPATHQVGDDSIFVPERVPAERWIVLLLLVSTCAYLWLFRRYTDLDPDEGIVLEGAQRILQGEVLYRDFFSFFTPGSYYFVACLFKIFGSSFLVARSALAVMGGVISVLTYLLARRVSSRWAALLVAGLVTLTALPYRFLVLHNWDSTLWACWALYCAVRWLESLETRNSKLETRKSRISTKAGTKLWALAMGSFASLTFLFEQSKGAGLMLGLLAGFAVIVWRGKSLRQKLTVDSQESRVGSTDYRDSADLPPSSGEGSPAAYCLLPSANCLLAGLAWPFLLTFLYFGAQHGLSPMLADWFWPLEHYSRANRVPYGYQNWSESAVRSLFGSGSWFERFVTVLTISPCFLVPVLPLVAVGLFVYWVRRMWRQASYHLTMRGSQRGCSGDGTGQGSAQAQDAQHVLINATLSGLLFSVVMVRADIVHLMYLEPLFCLVLAGVMEGRDIPGRLFGAIRPFLNACIVIAFGLFAMALLLRTIHPPYRLQTRRGVITMPGKDTVIDYVQTHVAPGEKILVYPYLPLYYYLTGTFSPTRYEYFQPGMHTLQQSREILSELTARTVGVALLEISFADKIPTSWPGTPVAAIASDPVVDYIVQNYRPCRVLRSPRNWRFLFMVRNDLSCP